eukprot:5498242-Amphidinium_carterae.1
MVRPVLGERQEKLQARPHIHVGEEPLENMVWPFLFEGHTLEREQLCSKGASDIAGRLLLLVGRCCCVKCGRPRSCRGCRLALVCCVRRRSPWSGRGGQPAEALVRCVRRWAPRSGRWAPPR